MKLDLTAKVSIRNKFKLVLTDQQGNVKQEGYAENMIMQNWWNRWLTRTLFEGEPNTINKIGYTWLGTGTGTIVDTRTNLFTHLDRQSHAYYAHEENWAERWASVTFRRQWSELEIQNSEITEIGLGGDGAGELCTHALIKDSEGNEIAISKGTLDVLTVYSTVFMILGDSFCGNQYLDFVRSLNSNALFSYLHERTNSYLFPGQRIYRIEDNAAASGAGWFIYTGISRRTSTLDEAMGGEEKITDLWFRGTVLTNYFSGSKFNACHRPYAYKAANYDLSHADLVYDATNKKISFTRRFGVNDSNSEYGISEIGVGMSIRDTDITARYHKMPLFRALLPIPDVWEGYAVEGEEVGTGDGAETDFTLDWAPFDPLSLKVYLDGVEQTEGTDYDLVHANGSYDIAEYSERITDGGPTKDETYNPSRSFNGGQTRNESNWYTLLKDATTSGTTYTGTQPWISVAFDEAKTITQARLANAEAPRVREFALEGRDSELDSWTTIYEGEMPNSTDWSVHDFSAATYKQFRLRAKTSWSSTVTTCRIQAIWLRDTRPHIEFATAPAVGEAITADYLIDFIPKDINHVLDVGFTLQFGDANIVAP